MIILGTHAHPSPLCRFHLCETGKWPPLHTEWTASWNTIFLLPVKPSLVLQLCSPAPAGNPAQLPVTSAAMGMAHTLPQGLSCPEAPRITCSFCFNKQGNKYVSENIYNNILPFSCPPQSSSITINNLPSLTRKDGTLAFWESYPFSTLSENKEWVTRPQNPPGAYPPYNPVLWSRTLLPKLAGVINCSCTTQRLEECLLLSQATGFQIVYGLHQEGRKFALYLENEWLLMKTFEFFCEVVFYRRYRALCH